MRFSPPFPSIEQLREQYIQSELAFHRGHQHLSSGFCRLSAHNDQEYQFLVSDRFEDHQVTVNLNNFQLRHSCSCLSQLKCCHHAVAAILLLAERFQADLQQSTKGHITYNREDMITRVLQEREVRSKSETFRLEIADNIFGIHQIITASGRTYELTIRDFQERNAYCTCPDFKTNKLGTCKHLLFAQREIIRTLPVERLTDIQPYPFVEIFCDPHQNYQISYFYRGKLTLEIASLLERYFNGKTHLSDDMLPAFVGLLKEAEQFQKILIRPEVREHLDRFFDDKLMTSLAETVQPDFSQIKIPLAPYQEEGVRFSLFKPGTIIADDMGLGKGVQAIAVAALKKNLYGLQRVLVICPAVRKARWKQEIQRVSDLSAQIVEGGSAQREALYRDSEAFFLITNYEAVVHDETILKRYAPDMIVLDEAQRIKNYLTRTSYAVKAIPKKHALVLTGTPIAKRPGDLYSIMNFIDPRILAPLWEFSMQHCTFSGEDRDRIVGYFNLEGLKERIAPWIMRRERTDIPDNNNASTRIEIPVPLHPRQIKQHSSISHQLRVLLKKPHMTGYDFQRLSQQIEQVRMLCNSTFLVDRQHNTSPKLDELEEILLDKLDIHHSHRKVVIFSEWKAMLVLIENLLNGHYIKATKISGDLDAVEAGEALKQFADDPDCKILLSSDCPLPIEGADTIIYLEPALNRKRMDERRRRLEPSRQKHQLTEMMLVSRNSIEELIAGGIHFEDELLTLTDADFQVADATPLNKKNRQLIESISALFQEIAVDQSEESLDLLLPPVPSPSGKQLQMFEENALHLPQRRRLRIQSQETASPSPLKPVKMSPEKVVTPELEKALEQGIKVLDSMVHISMGKNIEERSKDISIDPESGEVVLRFKLK